MPEIRKIFGVPGAGKTTYLLDELENVLSSGTPPERVAYLTFTRNARAEAKGRVMQRFGYTEEDLPYFQTIHSICFRQLGLNKTLVVNPAALKEFSAQYGFPMTFGRQHQALNEDAFFEDAGVQAGDKYLAFYHWMRHKMLPFEEAYKRWPENLNYFEVEQFIRAYDKFREEESLSDFTDFLTFAKFPLDVDVVFVDEAQDLSDLQWNTVFTFWKNAKLAYIAGDDDQAIFTWAGASPEILIDMAGKTKVLGKSWRLPTLVGDFAQKIVRQISYRKDKKFTGRPEQGSVRFVNSISQIEFNPDETWKILVRNNYLKMDLKRTLTAEGIPFSNTGNFSIGPSVLNSMFSWERLAKGLAIPTKHAVTMYGQIASQIGVSIGGKKKLDDARKNQVETVTLADLRNNYGLLVPPKTHWYDALSRIPDEDVAYIRSIGRNYGSRFFQQVLDLGDDHKREIPGLVDIYTIHGAKGSEADNVVLLGEMATRCQRQLQSDPDPEIRVWFVGATRAKKTLYIVGGNSVLDA